MKSVISVAVALVCVWAATLCAQEAKDDKPTSPTGPQKPPELTVVSGRFVQDDYTTIGGGVVYFVFQERLKELPHENTMEKVRAMSEVATEVDAEGNFYLEMKPGNFAIVYDPHAKFSEEVAKPGPESMERLRKLTKEQLEARVAAIIENAKKGLPIQDGKIEDCYIVENRFVRPPISDFGTMPLGVNQSVTVQAIKENDEPVDFPVLLKLRGKNGDICEPHLPTSSSPGRFVFADLIPQRYDVFAIGVKMAPSPDAEETTPTLENTAFIFEGEPMEHKVVVKLPQDEESSQDATQTPEVRASGRKAAGTKQK